MELMKIKELRKSFQTGERSLQVLKDVNLTINSGDFISLMGVSGSGKSTFLNILGSMDLPDSGEIIMHGQDITRLPENKLADFRLNHIGFVFQFHYLLPEFTVQENTAMPLMVKGIRKQKALDKASEMLEYLGMQDRLKHYPSEISGGEKQRTAIGRALINEPDILLADEPTGNLDMETSLKVLALFDRIHKDMGQTFFLVTHNPAIAERAATHYFLDEGKFLLK